MVKEWKIKAVEELKKMISSYPVIGVVNLHKIPASALQKIKRELGESTVLKVSKRSIIERALRESGLEELANHAQGQIALIFSRMNPFKLLFFLQKKTSSAPAKPGDVAEEDIIVPAGPTELAPGPAISTLTKVKIPAKIEGGKIVIQKDAVVCKKGEEVTQDIAAALNLLKIEPMKIGLKLLAIYENGKVYAGSVLGVSEEGIIEDLEKACSRALSLSLGLCFPTKENVEMLLQKAYLNAKALKENVGEVK